MAVPLSVERPPCHLIVIRRKRVQNERPPDAGGLFWIKLDARSLGRWQIPAVPKSLPQGGDGRDRTHEATLGGFMAQRKNRSAGHPATGHTRNHRKTEEWTMNFRIS